MMISISNLRSFSFNHKMLRDEEGRKAGLKLKEKSSTSVDNDVEMSDTKVNMESSKKKIRLTGVYGLMVVLTHKCRSVDSSHYVAWIKQENGVMFVHMISL